MPATNDMAEYSSASSLYKLTKAHFNRAFIVKRHQQLVKEKALHDLTQPKISSRRSNTRSKKRLRGASKNTDSNGALSSRHSNLRFMAQSSSADIEFKKLGQVRSQNQSITEDARAPSDERPHLEEPSRDTADGHGLSRDSHNGSAKHLLGDVKRLKDARVSSGNEISEFGALRDISLNYGGDKPTLDQLQGTNIVHSQTTLSSTARPQQALKGRHQDRSSAMRLHKTNLAQRYDGSTGQFDVYMTSSTDKRHAAGKAAMLSSKSKSKMSSQDLFERAARQNGESQQSDYGTAKAAHQRSTQIANAVCDTSLYAPSQQDLGHSVTNSSRKQFSISRDDRLQKDVALPVKRLKKQAEQSLKAQQRFDDKQINMRLRAELRTKPTPSVNSALKPFSTASHLPHPEESNYNSVVVANSASKYASSLALAKFHIPARESTNYLDIGRMQSDLYDSFDSIGGNWAQGLAHQSQPSRTVKQKVRSQMRTNFGISKQPTDLAVNIRDNLRGSRERLLPGANHCLAPDSPLKDPGSAELRHSLSTQGDIQYGSRIKNKNLAPVIPAPYQVSRHRINSSKGSIEYPGKQERSLNQFKVRLGQDSEYAHEHRSNATLPNSVHTSTDVQEAVFPKQRVTASEMRMQSTLEAQSSNPTEAAVDVAPEVGLKAEKGLQALSRRKQQQIAELNLRYNRLQQEKRMAAAANGPKPAIAADAVPHLY